MIFRQFLHHSPIAASYLFGCGGQGRCAVVDPVDQIDAYVTASNDTGMQITHVIDTHVHADHLSGGRRLARTSGAQYLVHESAHVSDAQSMREGDELVIGNVTIRVLHTPGHTPEHVCLLVTDRTRGPEPWCLLTGHTLFAGDMGRTELASSAEAGAHALFDTASRLRALPDYIEVWPGAFSGSVCGRRLSGKPATTIGFERRFNAAFREEDRDTFVRLMLADIPPRPPGSDAVRAANLGAQIPVDSPAVASTQ